MPVEIRYESGASEYAVPDENISPLSFGARYVSYDGVDRFLDQTNDLNLGLIVGQAERWPKAATTASDSISTGCTTPAPASPTSPR